MLLSADKSCGKTKKYLIFFRMSFIDFSIGGIITYIAVVGSAIVAGIIQTVTGFGAAVFMMLFIPYFFDMIAAPVIASAIALGLAFTLAWKFRKHIQIRYCLFPTLIYLFFSVTSINFTKKLNLEHLSLAF